MDHEEKSITEQQQQFPNEIGVPTKHEEESTTEHEFPDEVFVPPTGVVICDRNNKFSLTNDDDERKKRKASSWLADGCIRVGKQYKIICYGQFISFLLFVTGAVQGTMSYKCHLSAPTFTVGMIYLGLILLHIIPMYRRGRSSTTETTTTDNIRDTIMKTTTNNVYMFLNMFPLTASPWFYVLASVLDFYGNFFTVLAFRHTTITSVVLFDSLAIPSTMILSRIFLSRHYTALHTFGVVVCIGGVLTNLYQDYYDEDDQNETSYANNALLGDFYAILGGILYGADDMVCEYSVRRHRGSIIEYNFMIGCFAFLLSVIQAFIIERNEIAWFFYADTTIDMNHNEDDHCSRGFAWGLSLVGYVLPSIMGYVLIARFLQVSESAFLNISLLTGDFWSILFSIVAQHIIPRPLFFMALLFVIIGVFLYEMAPSPAIEDREFSQNMTNEEKKVLNNLC